MKLGAVILAAGSSTRFGNENKLLHLVDGTPLLHRVLGAFSQIELEEIVVVLGHEAECVKASLGGFDLRTVINHDYREGMGSSLSVGVKALLNGSLDGAFVCLGDLPGLTGSHVECVQSAFVSSRSERIVVPQFSRKRGHPVCFPRWSFDGLASLSGDKGARGLIQAEKDRVTVVDMPDDSCVRDMDTY